MREIKVIPCLDIREGRVVKGIHFVDLKDAGDPVDNAALYQREGADELAMLDIAATVENRKMFALRVPLLREVKAGGRFLSVEPLLEELARPDAAGHQDR